VHFGGRPLDLILEPGQFYFGGAHLRIGTLLGSCVAVTMWHPQIRIGGMCHYLLPTRGGQPVLDDEPLDGRYGDEALAMFMREIDQVGTSPSDYQAKLFGGGNQFASAHARHPIDVPTRNVDAGLRMLTGYGLHVVAKHVGGSGPRQVVLDLATGHVWVRHRRILKLEGAP
jgi:chemotaxis protein CheD